MTRDDLTQLMIDEEQRRALPPSTFNPAGPGYDMVSAVAADLKPDATGHWPSRVPETGLILKGRAHPTYHLTQEGEKAAGYEMTQRDGRDYSFPVGSLADQSLSEPQMAEQAREVAAARQRNAVRSHYGRREGWLTENPDLGLVAPRDPLDVAMYAAGGPLGRAAKVGVLAAGAVLSPSEAQAGPASTVRKGGEKLGELLGLHPTTTPRRIYDKTLEGGYSVNLPTGDIPSEGLMVGKYRNDDPRNLVVPREQFKQSSVKQHAKTNIGDLAAQDAYFGSWLSQPENKVYLDVSRRFDPDKIRVATKFGERTGQLAGYNVGTSENFPIGKWREFVASPEFRGRMDEMAGVGRDYLNKFPTKEWWDMHGSSFERAYGAQNLPQVAGFSAATAPVSNPYDNMRAMSEYMRRHLKGEPTIQPEFRIPEGGMGPWSAGKQLPLEQSRIANLNKAAAGDLASLQRAKVREEAMAMSGDPNAVVLDRHWARITEDPSRGIYANAQEGVIDTNARLRGMGDYDFVKSHVSEAARAANRDPRDYSADVWTGIRETIKRTDQLFGTPHKGSAITGESKSYQDIFQELVEKKAKHEGISVEALDKKLRSGDANLLSGMLASSSVLWGAYQKWQGQSDERL